MSDEHDRDDDVAELRTLFERARPDEVEWEPPPAGLWDRIAAAIEEPAVDAPAAPSRAEATVVPLAGRRRAWWLGLAVAAAAVVIVAAAVAVGGGDDGPQVVSAVDLEPLTGSGSGRAELVDRDGTLQVRLETDGVDPTDGYLELWLIDSTSTRLVSLGPLRTDGVYDVPAGVDPAEFPIVDVSVEPIDGDPTHSGQSVLRGELTL